MDYGPQTDVPDAIKVANVSDQPTLADSLGFQPYVHAIVKFLSSEDTKPPLTLSIEGEWGSGKSSFMLQLQKELQASAASEIPPGPDQRESKLKGFLQRVRRAVRRPQVMTVQFNAWRHDKEDSLWAAFALE